MKVPRVLISLTVALVVACGQDDSPTPFLLDLGDRPSDVTSSPRDIGFSREWWIESLAADPGVIDVARYLEGLLWVLADESTSEALLNAAEGYSYVSGVVGPLIDSRIPGYIERDQSRICEPSYSEKIRMRIKEARDRFSSYSYDHKFDDPSIWSEAIKAAMRVRSYNSSGILSFSWVPDSNLCPKDPEEECPTCPPARPDDPDLPYEDPGPTKDPDPLDPSYPGAPIYSFPAEDMEVDHAACPDPSDVVLCTCITGCSLKAGTQTQACNALCWSGYTGTVFLEIVGGLALELWTGGSSTKEIVAATALGMAGATSQFHSCKAQCDGVYSAILSVCISTCN